MEMAEKEWPLNSVENAMLKMWSVNLDYASQLNGVGFNKLDSNFGNSVAEKLSQYGHLTPRQRSACYKVLRKYRGQLLRQFGIDYDQIPVPTEDGEKQAAKGTVWLYQGNTLVVDTGYNARLVDALRVVPTRQWKQNGDPASRQGEKGVWTIPLSIDNIGAVRALLTDFPFLVIDPEAQAALDGADKKLASMVDLSGALDGEVDIPGLGITLLPFQKAAIEYARKVLANGGMYIADEMGLGKTVETYAIAQDHTAFPMLVGVPKVVWLNWAREGEKVLPGKSIALLAPSTVTKSMRRAVGPNTRIIMLTGDEDTDTTALYKPGTSEWHDIYIVAYNNLLKWRSALMEVPWALVAYDEAHLLKSRGAQRTKAASDIAKLAKYRLCLSGTPIPNAPAELITQINILERMEDLGGWNRFWRRHCQGFQRGHAYEQELNLKMRASFYLRRVKRDVYPELPEVRWVDVPVEMTNPARYEQTEADLLNFIKEKVEKDQEIIEMLLSIEDEDARAAAKKAATDDAYQRAMRAQVLTMINALRQVVAEEKIAGFYEWLDAWLETTTGNGHSMEGERSKQIVIFTDHRPITKAVAERYNAPAIIGGMDDGKKAQIEADFQAGRERVLVCSTQAAGLGITLTAASDVAFVEYQWRPMDMDQAVSRTYGRVNDLHGATAYQVLAPSTIDDWMLGKISDKRDVTGKVSDGGSILADLMHDLLNRGKEN